MSINTPLTGLEIHILSFFLENITEHFAIREIARKIKVDYKHVHSTIQKLAKKKIIIKKRQANIDLCSLNLKNDLIHIYYVEMLRSIDFMNKHKELKFFFQSIQEKIKTGFYSLVVFGSFAKGTETINSDLDIMIITPSRNIGEEIVRIINAEAILLKRKFQFVVLDEKEFIKSLESKEINVATEAFNNHIIIQGFEIFYHGIKQRR